MSPYTADRSSGTQKKMMEVHMNKSTKIIGILFGIFLLVLIPVVDRNTYHHIVLCQTLVNIVVVTGDVYKRQILTIL